MILQYILKLSISLALVWLFYKCVLRRLTFYGANRWYLAGYSFLSLFIPFININPFLESNSLTRNPIVNLFPPVEKYTGTIHQASRQSIAADAGHFNTWDWLAFIILAGTTIFLFQFLLRWLSFLRMRRKATLISTGGIRLYQVNETIIPFSFGNSVFINADLHTETELQKIIRHEFVHVRNRHTIDILWSEWLCIINWYNPFAWLLRSSIRQNLEFIADKKVIDEGLNKKDYQYLLLKVIGNNHFSIAPKFNFSSLKKRIAMMNRFKSARISALRFLFLVPLLSVLLLAFRQIAPAKDPPVPLPPAKEAPHAPAMVPAAEIQDLNEIKLQDTIPDVPLNDLGYFVDLRGKGLNQVVVVRDKDGVEIKRIPLVEWNKNEKEYTSKYGDIVPPPPPVPPVPPAKAPFTRIDIISDDYNITEKEAVIKLKDGKVERYDLKNAEERKTFEKKYGRIIKVSANAASPTTATVTTSAEVISVSPAKADNSTSVTSTTEVPTPPVSVVSVGNETVAVTPVKSNVIVSGHTVIAPMKATASEGVTVVGDADYSIPGKEDVLATITKKTTQAELNAIKEQLKLKGIDLTYETIEYNNKGVLVKIYGSMKSSDGSTNFVAKDFSQLVLSIIKNGDRTYFKVMVKDNKVTI